MRKQSRGAKALLLGEDLREGILKGEPLDSGSCVFCDKPVWISTVGYFTDRPDIDRATELAREHGKPLHKLCLLELCEIGKEVFIAIAMNMKANKRI